MSQTPGRPAATYPRRDAPGAPLHPRRTGPRRLLGIGIPLAGLLQLGRSTPFGWSRNGMGLRMPCPGRASFPESLSAASRLRAGGVSRTSDRVSAGCTSAKGSAPPTTLREWDLGEWVHVGPEFHVGRALSRLNGTYLTRRELLQRGVWLPAPFLSCLPSTSPQGISCLGRDPDVPQIVAYSDEVPLERRELLLKGLAFFCGRNGQEHEPSRGGETPLDRESETILPFVLPPSVSRMLDNARASLTESLSGLLRRWISHRTMRGGEAGPWLDCLAGIGSRDKSLPV